jgi:hypothetical protein
MMVEGADVNRDNENERGKIQGIIDEALVEDANEINQHTNADERETDQQIAVVNSPHIALSPVTRSML